MTPAPGEERVQRVWNPNVNDLHEYIEKLERENDGLLTRLREVEGERASIAQVIGWEAGEKTLLQAVTDEWHDFMMVCSHCSLIYDAASRGMISKPQTLPATVIRVMEDRENEAIDEAVKEATEELQARAEQAEQRVAQLEKELEQSCSC